MIIFNFFIYSSPVISFSLISYVYFLKCSIIELILIGVPHIIIWSLIGYYAGFLVIWQFAYFYIICYYLKSKINNVNKQIENQVENFFRRNSFYFCNKIKILNRIYSEISDYNNNCWSKFLFLIFISFAILINFITYSSLFGNMNLFERMAFAYVGIFCICLLLFLLTASSSLTYEAIKSYKLFSSCVAFHTKNTVSIKTFKNHIKVLKIN